MRKTLAGLVLTFGLITSNINAQEKKEMPRDTTIIEYKSDSLLKKEYSENIIDEKIYTLTGEQYNLVWEKTSELNDSGDVKVEKENAFEYKIKGLEKSSSLPKNLEKREELRKFKDYIIVKEYKYDEKGRLSLINKRENHKVGVNKKPNESSEIYTYLGESGQAIKWEDNDNSKDFNKGDNLSFYDIKKKEWVNINPEIEYKDSKK